jgi:hypothetical protein
LFAFINAGLRLEAIGLDFAEEFGPFVHFAFAAFVLQSDELSIPESARKVWDYLGKDMCMTVDFKKVYGVFGRGFGFEFF